MLNMEEKFKRISFNLGMEKTNLSESGYPETVTENTDIFYYILKYCKAKIMKSLKKY